jgi:hypothetical protein
LCIGYDLFKNQDLLETLVGDTFEINFNRTKGGSDVRVPVSLMRDKPDVALSFNKCAIDLLEIVEKKFGR